MDNDDFQSEDSGDDWSLSFADMMTLLLCFFIMLMGASTPDPAKLEAIKNSLSEAMGKKEQPSEKYVSLQELGEAVNQIIKEEQLEDQVDVDVSLNGVAISAKGAFFFASGSAELSGPARQLMQKLAPPIKEVTYYIAIEGHTDDLPMSNEIYPSNWELSSARSSTVVRFLIGEGVPQNRLQANGFADTRPVVKNNSPENRAKNRRVVIRFLNIQAKEAKEPKGT